MRMRAGAGADESDTEGSAVQPPPIEGEAEKSIPPLIEQGVEQAAMPPPIDDGSDQAITTTESPRRGSVVTLENASTMQAPDVDGADGDEGEVAGATFSNIYQKDGKNWSPLLTRDCEPEKVSAIAHRLPAIPRAVQALHEADSPRGAPRFGSRAEQAAGVAAHQGRA